MLNDQTKEVPLKSTTDKEDHNNLDNIIKELPKLEEWHNKEVLKNFDNITWHESINGT